MLAACSQKKPDYEAQYAAPYLSETGAPISIDSLAPLEPPTNACIRFYDGSLFLHSKDASKVLLYDLRTHKSKWTAQDQEDRIYAETAPGQLAWLEQQNHYLTLFRPEGDTVLRLSRRQSIDRYLASDGLGNVYFQEWGGAGKADLVIAEIRSGKDFWPLRRVNLHTLKIDTVRIPVVDRENLKHTYNRSRTINSNGYGLVLTTYAHSDTVTLYQPAHSRYRKLALPINRALFYRDLDPERQMRDADYNASLNANSMWTANTSFSPDGAWFSVVVGRPETRESHVTDYELLVIDTALTTCYKGMVSDTLGRKPFRHFVLGDTVYVQRQHSSYPRTYGTFFLEGYPIKAQGRKFSLQPGSWIAVQD